MKYDFVTVGGAVEDITVYTRETSIIENRKDLLCQKLMAFEYGAKLKVEKSFSTFGGGASNAAVNLAGLGFGVAILAALGDDLRAQAILDNFQKKNVDTRLVRRVRKCESGFSFLVAGFDGEHVAFPHRAANDSLRIGREEMAALRDTTWIYLASLSGKWEDVLKKVFSVKSTRVAWNPGQTQLSAGFKALSPYLRQTFVLSLNKDEAIELVKSSKDYADNDNKFFNNSRNLLKALKSFGPQIVVVTNGQRGADAYDGEKFFHQDIVKSKKVVDTAGVGDAFASTFVAGLELFRGDIQRAMLAGCRNTASVVSAQGAQNGLLRRKRI